MQPPEFIKIAQRLLEQPAVPYFEDAVREAATQICQEHGLAYRIDGFGNLLVKLCTAPKLRPFALAAHLDHPGFHVKRQAGGKFTAQFHGGVGDDYFKAGIPLRLMPGGIPAVLGRRLKGEKVFQIQARVPVTAKPRFAVWELPDFSLVGDRIVARACDDLIGVASILATMIELKRSRAKVNVLGVISRAEEVGFHGALAIAATKGIPRNALVVSLETSRELAPVKMGEGVIVRVGDRSSIFDSAATRFLVEVGNGLHSKKSPFRFQRALMSGGTCEATAYQEYGFRTCAVCVALGHYHNCAPANRIAAEYVSLNDAVGMVKLLTAAAKAMPSFSSLTDRLPKRLEALAREARRRLKAPR